MNRKLSNTLAVAVALAWGAASLPASAEVVIQCKPGAVCKHLAAGDGFVTMADGTPLYIFGFSDVTGVPAADVMNHANLGANFPAPPLNFSQGDEVFLTLTNVGMIMRPDLFDPHSVHFHGFPNAAPVFDGEPESSQGVNMGASFTYYYNLVEPGTYMYHCHVEAAEHMQMGMLGTLNVHPAQNGTTINYEGKDYSTFAYNDADGPAGFDDGSTGYNREYTLQLGSFDSVFHEEHIAVQPLPFAGMKDNYAMINGRGYPDTVIDAPLPAPADNGGKVSQPVSSLVTANAGERVLLRLSNLSVTNFYTVTVLGLPMKVVGTGARILRTHNADGTPRAAAAGGKELYYQTASVTLGGGEAADVLIDIPATDPSGTTYFLYTTNLNFLSNGPDDFGGMMTEIRVN
jgi:FtsP/CotA-like multicopper oxidase with cupredoxin domain